MAGSVLGTIQYMSPEQIEGREVDARSDIFSFGAVVYEMATGKRAFEGKSQLTIASAILEKEPEAMSTKNPVAPAALDFLVATCLAKDRDERYQSAQDVRLQLKGIAASPGSAASGFAEGRSRRSRLYLGIGAAVAFALASVAIIYFLMPGGNVPALSVRAYIPPPPGTTFRIRADWRLAR